MVALRGRNYREDTGKLKGRKATGAASFRRCGLFLFNYPFLVTSMISLPTSPESRSSKKSIPRRYLLDAVPRRFEKKRSESAKADAGLVSDSYLPVPRYEVRKKWKSVTISAQGRYGAIHLPTYDPREKAKRGNIHGMSPSARKRLLDTLNRLEQNAPLPVFVTLTFPDFFPSEKVAKDCLDAFSKRLERAHPTWAFIWRLERIVRKSGQCAGQAAPHFHLFIFTHGQWLDKDKLSADWAEVVGSVTGDGLDYAHLRAGTKTESIRAWNGVMYYACKYLSKEEEIPVTGRAWGIYGRKFLPLGELKQWKVSVETGWKIRRIFRKLLEKRRGKRSCVPSSIYVDHAIHLVTKIVKLCEDS